MSWLGAAIWFVLGSVAAVAALSARMRMLRDREFVRGWTARLRVEDEQDPEVRRV